MNRDNLENTIHAHIRKSTDATMARYNEGYNNTLYRAATKRLGAATANKLINTALALCGDTRYTVGYMSDWGPTQLAFLAEFCKE